MEEYSSSSYKVESSLQSDICDLPIDVVGNILGHLPMRDLVRTCLLTRRWQQLWRSIPCLIFRRGYTEPTSYFINFLHKFCTLRDPSYPIQTFSLETDIALVDDALSINNAIETAVNGRVQYLFLDIHNICEPYALPSCVFRSETLTKFYLSLPMHRHLILPDRVSLPWLKVLYLADIVFADLRSIQQLCSCPLLEEVHIEKCCWKLGDAEIGSTVTISAPNLKRLSFNFVYMMSGLRWVHCESLKELFYMGRLRYEFDVSGTNKLDRVELDLERGTVAKHVLNLLNRLSSTTCSLLLSSESEVFDSWGHLFELERFDNLTELTLVGCMSFGATVNIMLRNSPSLQNLNIETWDYVATRLPRYGLADPDALLHLKKITISSSGQESIDTSIVAMLLMSSPVLEVMVLKVLREWVADLKCTVTNLPKVKEDCQIVYANF